MPWYSPCSWFRKDPLDHGYDDDNLQFSRRAVDSTNVAMDVTVTLRMPEELRERAARKARALGFKSTSEYLRHLLTEALDEDGKT